MKFFKLEEFIMDLNRQFQNYCNINNQDADVNKDVSRITETFINTLNSHAPLNQGRDVKKNWMKNLG